MSTKKYYQRVSKLEFNADVKDGNDTDVNGDVDELKSRILKATEAPKVQVK